jgi:antitoxin component YwqK of YwqJK toxin-antitoxin module
MKTVTVMILGLLAGAPSLQAQQPMDLDLLEERRGVYLQRPTFEPYTGPVEARWEDGELRERGTLLNGRWDGVRESFYQLGSLKARETYSNGVLNGPFEAYFKKGAPSDKGAYVDGRLDGPYESYWLRQKAEDGAFEAGRMCGDWTRYYPQSSYGLRIESTASYPPCPSRGAQRR